MALDTVELLMAIQEEFGVDIPDEDAEKFLTVGDLYQWLIACFERDFRDYSDKEVWNRLVRVFVRQLNLKAEEIRPEAYLTRDLGID